ncbi:hypothetical protein ACLB2K_021628 [Fragaria x ananassa]
MARAHLHPSGLQQLPRPLSIPGESAEFQFSGQITQNFKQSQSGQKIEIRRTRRDGKCSGKLLESARVEARPRRCDGNGKPKYDTVYGVKPTNQCSGIMQAFDLSADEFFAINPNLNCNAIFVGQWICISGSA